MSDYRSLIFPVSTDEFKYSTIDPQEFSTLQSSDRVLSTSLGTVSAWLYNAKKVEAKGERRIIRTSGNNTIYSRTDIMTAKKDFITPISLGDSSTFLSTRMRFQYNIQEGTSQWAGLPQPYILYFSGEFSVFICDGEFFFEKQPTDPYNRTFTADNTTIKFSISYSTGGSITENSLTYTYTIKDTFY